MGTEEYDVYTPRGLHKAPSVDTPDRFALRLGVEEVWNEEEAPATEATEEQDERLERLAIR
jgi:hypothetical protein